MSKVGARVATGGEVLRRKSPSSSRDEIALPQNSLINSHAIVSRDYSVISLALNNIFVLTN